MLRINLGNRGHRNGSEGSKIQINRLNRFKPNLSCLSVILNLLHKLTYVPTQQNRSHPQFSSVETEPLHSLVI
ncbi:hypothetical protein ACET3Z_012739 [Daucus carota]